MTFKQIIYNIQNLKEGFVQSDDNKLSDRQVAFIINYYRAVLIQQQLSKGKTLSNYFYQTINDVPFEKFCTAIGTNLLRSKDPLPQVVSSNFKDMFSYVGVQDGSKKFDEVAFNDLQTIEASRYAKKYPKYCIKDRYLYLYCPPTVNLEKLMVRGVFETPEKVEKLSTFQGFDFEYPISAYMLSTIYEMMMSKELKFGLSIPKDLENDGEDK